jgi:hypothetical protein
MSPTMLTAAAWHRLCSIPLDSGMHLGGASREGTLEFPTAA